jgi:mannose-1-phosphate guanylyltransferase
MTVKRKVYTAIMCGGEGKRLWPLSRRSFPKYYIRLKDGESLFQKSFRRALLVSDFEDILLVTTEINKHNALKQAREILPSFPSENLIIRPEGKETFATLACALSIMHDRNADDNDVLICSPADHVIADNIGYKKSLLDAVKVADDTLVTIGILPTHPSSDFGYIEYHPKVAGQIHYVVKRFTEKPDAITATKFLEQGNYLWNGGYYIGTKATYLREIIEQSEVAAEIIISGSLGLSDRFDELPEKSIDLFYQKK